jgi:hypothetical protein
MSTELPSMSHTFHISTKGIFTGKNYEGTFTYDIPNIGQKLEISKMVTRLNGDLQSLPFSVKSMHEMLATLTLCLTQSPDWWEGCEYGRKLHDGNIIQDIYTKCIEFEDTWIKNLSEDKDKKNKKDVPEQPKKDSQG